jgi:hypothetical protein
MPSGHRTSYWSPVRSETGFVILSKFWSRYDLQNFRIVYPPPYNYRYCIRILVRAKCQYVHPPNRRRSRDLGCATPRHRIRHGVYVTPSEHTNPSVHTGYPVTTLDKEDSFAYPILVLQYCKYHVMFIVML